MGAVLGDLGRCVLVRAAGGRVTGRPTDVDALTETVLKGIGSFGFERAQAKSRAALSDLAALARQNERMENALRQIEKFGDKHWFNSAVTAAAALACPDHTENTT